MPHRPAVEPAVPLIEVTGIDGAGKSTLASGLAARLGWEMRKVSPFDAVALREDGLVHDRFGAAAGDAFRGVLLARALLAHAATATTPTVFDRYVESALMWWSVKNVAPLPPVVLDALPRPRAVVFLDVPVDVGLRRRAGTTERSAAAEHDFLEACAGYLRDAAQAYGWITVDATRAADAVIAEVTARLTAVVGSAPPNEPAPAAAGGPTC